MFFNQLMQFPVLVFAASNIFIANSIQYFFTLNFKLLKLAVFLSHSPVIVAKGGSHKTPIEFIQLLYIREESVDISLIQHFDRCVRGFICIFLRAAIGNFTTYNTPAIYIDECASHIYIMRTNETTRSN